MSRLFRKVVLFLVFVIAVLQIIHMSLMSRLESKKAENEKEQREEHRLSGGHTQPYRPSEITTERDHMYKSLQSLSSVLDSSGEYRILSFISTSEVLKSSQWKYSVLSKVETLDGFGAGTNLYRKNDVAIVSHGTVYQMHHLDLLARRWHGLMSIAIFALSVQQLPIAVEIILLLRYCNPSVRERVSFHLIYPLNFSAKLSNRQAQSVLDFLIWPNIVESYPKLKDFISKSHCTGVRSAIEQLVASEESINYNHKVPYPNNLLRNIGRRYALTEYTFVIDIDLVPSTNFYQNFLEFGHRTKLFKETDSYSSQGNLVEPKVVFVVPTYEIDLNLSTFTYRHHSTSFFLDDEDALIPQDKLQLIAGIEQRYIRPFYIELCWKCQKYTDYEAWLHASSLTNASHPNKVDILFEVMWHDPWEPFYVSHNTVPFYDERFRQYGFNRISQVCELNIAGYKFAVLNNAFLVHKGFKTVNNFHANKDVELEHNRVLFRKFKLQLKERYPSSKRKC